MTAPLPPLGPVSGARAAEEMREEGLLPVEPGCRRAMPVAEVPGIDLAAIAAREAGLRAQMAEARRWLENTGGDASSCFIGHAIGKALAALSREAPMPDTAATGGAVDSDRGGDPTPEEMARLDAGHTTTQRALRAGALTEAQARAEKAEAESERWRALAEEYRAAHREGNDIV